MSDAAGYEEDLVHRYHAALHGMQTGVAHKMHHSPKETTPKHLRVGVNSAHVSVAALVRVLVGKGLFTREELNLALAQEMEAERDRYQDWLNTFYGNRGGSTVTLA